MRLGSVITVNPESIRNGYPFDEIEYIDISSVGTGTLQGAQHLQLASAPSRAKRIVRPGDTLLATVRPNLRSFLFARNPKKNTIASTGFAVLRANRDIDSRFLYYTVTNQPFTDYLTANAKGAAYPAVDTDTIERAEIYFPTLPSQRKIAAILSAYDDLIENNNRRIKILEEMAQAIYREWFVHFRFPGHEKVKMVDSPMGKIPEGWEVSPIGDVIETMGGGTPSTKVPEYWQPPEVTWFTPSDLTASNSMFMFNSSKKISLEGFNRSSAKLFPAQCVMMTSRATIGVVSVNTIPACTNQGFIVCLPNENLSWYQIYHWILENKDRIISIASGATYKEISRSEFRELPIVTADAQTRKAFIVVMEPLCNQIQILLMKNINLRQTRDLLLPKLISGEVDVSDLDIDTGGLNA